MNEPDPNHEAESEERRNMHAELDAAIAELDRLRSLTAMAMGGSSRQIESNSTSMADAQPGAENAARPQLVDSAAEAPQPAAADPESVENALDEDELFAPATVSATRIDPEPSVYQADAGPVPGSIASMSELGPDTFDEPDSSAADCSASSDAAQQTAESYSVPDPMAKQLEPETVSESPVAVEPAAAVEPTAAATPSAAEPLSMPAMQTRLFGLKRALDAHRHGLSRSEIREVMRDQDQPVPEPEPMPASVSAPAGEAEPAGSSAVVHDLQARFGARVEPGLPRREPFPEPESPAALAAEPQQEPASEREGRFGRWKAVEPEPAAGEPEPPAAPPASAEAPKPERRGWFGRRKAAEPEVAEPQPAPAAAAAATIIAAAAAQPPTERRASFGHSKTPQPPPDAVDQTSAAPANYVDLDPVRAAMESVALQPRGSAIAEAVDAEGAAQPSVTAALATGSARIRSITVSAAVDHIGVLLVNLGTPDAAKAKEVRAYLREFLSDPRVIENNTLAWRLVLKGIILPFRPRSKARAYRKVWNRERNESPLKTITRSQAEQLATALASIDHRILVDWAMRYGNPSIESRIRAMIAEGCERILLVPLYPQYSSATTATVCDEAFRVLTRIRNQPAIRVAPAYYDDPVYIEAIASSIRTTIADSGIKPEVILASYHGMPLEYVEKGDPYLSHCVRTTELLRTRLGKNHNNLIMTFQSRFGRAKWLEPYTDETLRNLAKDGVKNVAVTTPGFAADCLETLEEIAIENAQIFKKRGGKSFVTVPCLNDSARGMAVINEIVMRELRGWI